MSHARPELGSWSLQKCARKAADGINNGLSYFSHRDFWQIVVPDLMYPKPSGQESLLMNPRPNPDVPADVMQHVTIAWLLFLANESKNYPPTNLQRRHACRFYFGVILSAAKHLSFMLSQKAGCLTLPPGVSSRPAFFRGAS